MPQESDKVIALRRLIDERYPSAKRSQRILPTGVPSIDRLLGGGLFTGTLTEFVSGVLSGGSQLSLGSIILSTRLARQRIALVDAAGTFDLDGLDDDDVAHLIWIQCLSLRECWRAADLAVRDPNYSIIVIDIRGFSDRDVLKTRDAIWVRLQRAAELADTAIVVQTDTACVPNAARRVVFPEPLPGDSLLRPRAEIIESLQIELQRSRKTQGRLSA
jgi:hypothetical protein